MMTRTAIEARVALEQLIDEVTHEPILITGERANAMLIVEDDWSAVQETLARVLTYFKPQRRTKVTIMFRLQLTILCAVVLTACGDSSTFDAAGDNPICTLFNAAELSGYVGNSLLDGKNAGTGLGCQWLTKHNNGDVMIAVVPKTLHEAPTQLEGYAALPDVGMQGFTAPFVDGWSAAAIVGEESIRVSVAGEVASAASAELLLKETIKRRGNLAP